MKQRSRTLALGLALTLTLGLTRVASAYLIPSFDADGCAWKASHVVVASEGDEIDGALTVLESWRGDLKPGDALNIPELAEFESEKTREIHDRSGFEKEGAVLRHVTGARLVLFLVKKTKTLEGGKTEIAWRPATPTNGGMQVSVVWIESGDAHALVQVMNPGPRLIVRVSSEAELKARVFHAGQVRDALAHAAAAPDLAERARALEPFTSHELGWASWSAFEKLTGCGEKALPVFRRLLDAREGKPRELVIRALAGMGQVAGPELAALLGRELDFWKTRSPTLPQGWWDRSKTPDSELLSAHFADLRSALAALETVRFPACEPTVLEVRELARSTAALGASDQLTGDCDRVLGRLHEPAGASDERPAEAARDDPSERVHTPTLAEIPLTTPEDEARLHALEERLAGELASDRRFVARRPALRGEATDEDLDAALASAIESAVVAPRDDWWSFRFSYEKAWNAAECAPAVPEKFGSMRAVLAPDVARLEPVLHAGKVTAPGDLEQQWIGLVTQVGLGDSVAQVEGLETALLLEGLGAFEKGEPRGAAERALDLWRLETDLARDERRTVAGQASSSRDAARLVRDSLARLSAPDLAATDRELATLESTLPSLTHELHRLRLAYECFFRACFRGEHSGEWALDDLTAQERLRDRRTASLRRHWERFHEVARDLETAVATLPPEQAWARTLALAPAHDGIAGDPWARPSVARWLDLAAHEVERRLGDLGRIRALRLLAAARRFELTHGAKPADASAALGRAVGLLDADPFTGKPLELRRLESGGLAVTFASHLGRPVARERAPSRAAADETISLPPAHPAGSPSSK